jgi:hypothetical protein
MCIVCEVWAISLAGWVLEKEEGFLFPSYPLSYVYCVCSVGYISGWMCSGLLPQEYREGTFGGGSEGGGAYT